MEPQLRGCGNSDQVRFLEDQTVLLQWSRSSEAAETKAAVYETKLADFASMEPQLRGCGNWPAPGSCWSAAMRFNGAAAQRLRKPPVAGAKLQAIYMLQWSRSSEAAETGLNQKDAANQLGSFNGAAAQRLRKLNPGASVVMTLRLASMEPQLRGCGNFHPYEFARWLCRASMEPQLRGCGNWWIRSSSKCPFKLLQWSRSSEAAETRANAIVRLVTHTASMEPQLRGCGNPLPIVHRWQVTLWAALRAPSILGAGLLLDQAANIAKNSSIRHMRAPLAIIELSRCSH